MLEQLRLLLQTDPGAIVIILVVLAITLCSLVNTLICRPIRLFFRSQNIKNAGWPPSHCDADGDAVEL